jgi:uncharacterized membrane protein YeaQ/YmgE (transglycosylase-associated protein family)
MHSRPPEIFISYSREDSEAALKLVRELKAAGIAAWIDQLEIVTGDLWDVAVEEALRQSPCLLVLLSPTSVASKHVMDEVSYALDKKKTILPVVIERCEIPLPLRRLQFIDLTADHDARLKTLVGTLDEMKHEAVAGRAVGQVWLYRGLSVITLGAGYVFVFTKGNAKNSFEYLSLIQLLFLLMNFVAFLLIKSPPLLLAREIADAHGAAAEKAYRRLGYTNGLDWDEAKRLAENSLEQFRRMWLFALSTWLMLYLVFYFINSPQQPTGVKAFLDISSDLLNVGSHGAILACYIVLSKDTNDRRSSPLAWSFLVAIIGAVELLVVLPLLIEGKAPSPLLSAAFGVMVGSVGGMVLGLFVGQLDNDHMAAPMWLLALLFGYAVIQPLYPALKEPLKALAASAVHPTDGARLAGIVDLSPAILIGSAGIFKLLLCDFLYRSFKNGRLLFYFARKRVIAASVDGEWADFKTLLKKQRLVERQKGTRGT